MGEAVGALELEVSSEHKLRKKCKEIWCDQIFELNQMTKVQKQYKLLK